MAEGSYGGTRRLTGGVGDLALTHDLREGRMGSVAIVRCIGIAGQSALLQAFEASHGVDFKNYMDGVFLNAPFYLPAFLMRAQGRGWRRALEGGVL